MFKINLVKKFPNGLKIRKKHNKDLTYNMLFNGTYPVVEYKSYFLVLFAKSLSDLKFAIKTKLGLINPFISKLNTSYDVDNKRITTDDLEFLNIVIKTLNGLSLKYYVNSGHVYISKKTFNKLNKMDIAPYVELRNLCSSHIANDNIKEKIYNLLENYSIINADSSIVICIPPERDIGNALLNLFMSSYIDVRATEYEYIIQPNQLSSFINMKKSCMIKDFYLIRPVIKRREIC